MSRIQSAIQNPGKAIRYVYDRADRELGKQVFGKPVGFRNIVAGNLAMNRAQRSSEISQDINISDEFININQPFDPDLIKKIQNKYQNIIEDDQYAQVMSEYKGQSYLRSLGSWDERYDLFEEIPELTQLVNDEIISLLHQYYRSHIQLIRVQAYRTYHIPPRVVKETELYSNYWHCDAHTTDHTKMFVYLSDVSEADGPFHILDRNDTNKLLNRGFNRGSEGVPDGVVEKEANMQKFTGEAGTTALANTQKLLHRAGNPEEGRHRDMLMMQFAPAKEPLSENWPQETNRDIVDGYSRLFAY